MTDEPMDLDTARHNIERAMEFIRSGAPAIDLARMPSMFLAVGSAQKLLAEVVRLTAALRLCEHVLHRAEPTDAQVHAAQQAAGAYATDWSPERILDDLPDWNADDPLGGEHR